MQLVNTHDGIPAYLIGVAALLIIAGVGAFIGRVIRTARDAVDCRPHPDPSDEDEQPAEVTA